MMNGALTRAPFFLAGHSSHSALRWSGMFCMTGQEKKYNGKLI